MACAIFAAGSLCCGASIALPRGNPGDHRFCREGVWELRVDCGPGYRVYFARPAVESVLLLGGGSKRSQAADIDAAVTRWKQYTEQQ